MFKTKEDDQLLSINMRNKFYDSSWEVADKGISERDRTPGEVAPFRSEGEDYRPGEDNSEREIEINEVKENLTLDEELESNRQEVEDKRNNERHRTFEIQEKKESKPDEESLESSESEDPDENHENDSVLRKAREALQEIEEFPDNIIENEVSSLSKERELTPKKFREKVKNIPEKFVGSTAEKAINFIRDGVCDWKMCKSPREGFAETVSDTIIEVLTKVEENEEGLLKEEIDALILMKIEELLKIKGIIDFGGGYGDNLKATIKKIKKVRKSNKKINGVCLDNKTSLSKRAERDVEITGSYQDAYKTSFKDDSFDLVMATHLLQEIKGIENKKKVLLEMKRISRGKIVLMVEEKRSGFDGIKDKANHFVNNFNTKFDVLGEEEYKELFEELGFTIESEVKSVPNKITYLLKFKKEKVE